MQLLRDNLTLWTSDLSDSGAAAPAPEKTEEAPAAEESAEPAAQA